MDSQDISLFRLSREGQLGEILVPFEYVISVTTRGTTLYTLTSNGRIIMLNEEFKVTGEAKLPPQKKQTCEHARIDYVDISGVLIVLFNNTLYFFRFDDRTADLVYSKTDVHCFDLSSIGTQRYFPEHDLVYVTTRNQVVRVLLSIGEQSKERVVWKWRADSQVTALAYDGSAVCLSTQSGCFVYPFDDPTITQSDPILAFPIDQSVLPLNGAPPSICHVNESNFVVAGAMPDIALFVDGSGSAARPPLVWHKQHPRSVVKTESSIVVIGETKLIVFDNSSTGRIRQELTLPAHPCASGLLADAVVIFTRDADADVFCVRELSWAQKANDLLEKGNLSDAHYLVTSNAVRSDEDLITYRQVHTRLGFDTLSTDEEKAVDMLMDGQVSPFDITTHFAAIFDTTESPADKISDVILVEKIITRVLEEEWSEEQHKDWATLLTIARVRLSENPIDLIDVLETAEAYDEQSVKDYCEGRKIVNAQLVLLAISSLSEALSMEWLDPSLHPLIDRALLVTLLQRIDSKNVTMVMKWKDFIMEETESEQLFVDFIRKNSTWFQEEFVIELFKGRDNELEVILGLYNNDSSHSSVLKIRLVELTAARLSSSREDLSPDEETGLRKLLIEIILSEKDEGIVDLLAGDQLTVERVVAENRASPEKAIHGIIENVEFPGALQAIQQIIHHFSSSHSSLSTHFLQQLKRKCESDPSAASSLRLPEVMRTVIEASPFLIEKGAIKFIPDNSTLETFAPLIFRELQSVNDGSVSNRMARAFAQRAMSTLEDPAPKSSFKVTDSTRCGVCSKRFDPCTAINYLPTGRIIHGSCQPYLNLCPITNQLFRG